METKILSLMAIKQKQILFRNTSKQSDKHSEIENRQISMVLLEHSESGTIIDPKADWR